MTELTQQISSFLYEQGLARGLTAVALAFLLAIVFKLALRVTGHNLKRLGFKTKTNWTEMLVGVLDRTKSWVIFLWLLYLQAHLFLVNPEHMRTARDIVVVVTMLQFGIWGYHLLKQWRKEFLDKKETADGSAAAALGLIYALAQAAFFVAIVLVGLANLGVDIGALLAGLGVGGIAVALAAQNVLGDLLASLSIVLDKPFVVGDFITVGTTDMGTVEAIGLKTTRVRSLTGEELIFSNRDLLASRIRNFKSMWRRRVVLKISVTYSTPPEKLEKIPDWIRGFVEESQPLNFERCHLASNGDWALNYELVFWVKDPDYVLYMNEQQALFLKIIRKFQQEKIEFAFPTRTVIVEPGENPVTTVQPLTTQP